MMISPLPPYNAKTVEPSGTSTTAPAVVLDQEMKNELLSQSLEEGVVIVHCSYNASEFEYIRIWSSTVLIDLQSGSRSGLHHAENITIAPVWMEVIPGTTTKFTLIFAPLPKACETFDLYEDIPQSGGFHVKGIKRNRSDIYQVTIR